MLGGRPTSLTFLPGDRHAAAGCTDGGLLILDVGAGVVLERVPAHSGDVAALTMTPDSVLTLIAHRPVFFLNLRLV